MAYAPHEYFKSLYDAYTGANSTGQHLTKHMANLSRRDPIFVVTGADFVVFPGDGNAPLVESFRHSTRGFVELTAISHLGPALAWIFRLRELGYATWKDDARRLLERIAQVRTINTLSYWQTIVNVEAFKGYEPKIVDLVEYTCDVTARFLNDCLRDETIMTFEHLRNDFLDATDNRQVPVAINDVMIATFTLAYLDIAHRMIRWLRSQPFDWSTLMVLLSGKSGRPSAGLTWATNNNCHLLWRASSERLKPENVHITPHGPSISLAEVQDRDRSAEVETQARELFLHLRANVEVSRLMFAGYPSFTKSIDEPPVIQSGTTTLHAMPRLRSPDDRLTAITRLRFVMEDPTQLLSNAVAHFVIDQLCQNNNRPESVVIPGFTNVPYPGSQRS